MTSTAREPFKLGDRGLRDLADPFADRLQVKKLRVRARHGFGRHILEQFGVVVTNPDFRICRLKDDNLGLAVALQSHGETIKVGQHFLTLHVHRAEIEGHRRDAVGNGDIKSLEVLIFHWAVLSWASAWRARGWFGARVN